MSWTRWSSTPWSYADSPGERCPVNKALLDTDIYSEVLKAKNPTVAWK